MAYTQLLTRDTYKVVEKKKSLVQKGIGDNVEPCIQVNSSNFQNLKMKISSCKTLSLPN